MVVVVVLLAACVGLLTLLVLGLLRSHAEILRALHELGISMEDGAPVDHRPRTVEGVPQPRRADAPSRASDISGLTPAGDAALIGVVGVERTTLVAFLTSGCLTCRGFWSALAEGSSIGGARIVIVTKGPGGESPSAVAKLAPRDIPTVMSDEAWDDYGVEVAPYFVLADGASGRVIGEGAAATWDQLVHLMDSAQDDVSPDGVARAERALRAAGIGPGDPQLHHRRHDAPSTEQAER